MAKTDDMRDMGQIIADGIAEGIQRNSPKKVPFGRYDPKSPAHPNKAVPRSKLSRACFQNGYRMDPKKLTNEEIDGLNAITRPGRYINRRMEVVIQNDGSQEVLELRYNNKTADQRFENKNHWRNMLDIVTQVVAEQALKPEPVFAD